MTITTEFLLLLIGCTLVTAIPRILPFVLARSFTISKPVEKWLSYLPICIFTGLIVENLITQHNNAIQVNWLVVVASLPTILIALLTKSLLTTVLVGVCWMAFLRFIF